MNTATILEEKKILLVEDEKDQRERLKYVLETEGAVIDEAENANDAIAMLNGNGYYNLVITDLKMPGGKDGLDVLREAKRISEHTEVIVITAYGTVNSAIQAMINGAYDYVQKPIRMPEFRVKIERALHQSEIAKQQDSAAVSQANLRSLMHELESDKMRFLEINRMADEILSEMDKKNPFYRIIKAIADKSS